MMGKTCMQRMLGIDSTDHTCDAAANHSRGVNSIVYAAANRRHGVNSVI
jgi:hypothetical protein